MPRRHQVCVVYIWEQRVPYNYRPIFTSSSLSIYIWSVQKCSACSYDQEFIPGCKTQTTCIDRLYLWMHIYSLLVVSMSNALAAIFLSSVQCPHACRQAFVAVWYGCVIFRRKKKSCLVLSRNMTCLREYFWWLCAMNHILYSPVWDVHEEIKLINQLFKFSFEMIISLQSPTSHQDVLRPFASS